MKAPFDTKDFPRDQKVLALQFAVLYDVEQRARYWRFCNTLSPDSSPRLKEMYYYL
jgi:hypothetical protein